MKTFETFQPATITPNSITSPSVFNGFCLVRKYEVTVKEVVEPVEVLQERLLDLWTRRSELKITHSANMDAMESEAKRLGIELR